MALLLPATHLRGSRLRFRFAYAIDCLQSTKSALTASKNQGEQEVVDDASLSRLEEQE